MKFLLDMPVSPSLLDVLDEYNHEGVHASLIGRAFAPDDELLELARKENRVIITADLDFPRLLALSFAVGPGVILFRGGNFSDKEMESLLRKVLEEVQPDDLHRSICVVDPNRVRITRLPINKK